MSIGSAFLLAALIVLIMIQLVRKAPTWPSAIGRCATAAVLGIFVAESVSLHGADAIFYRPAGPVLFIAWLWLGCGWVSAAAAANERRGRR